MSTPNTLIYTFSLRKKILLGVGALLFVWAAYLLLSKGVYVLSLLPFSIFVFAMYKILTVHKLLSVTPEGVIPHAVLKKGATSTIPWPLISKLYVANQQTRRYATNWLAIQLHDAQLLEHHQSTVQNVLGTLRSQIQNQMSDRGTADIYLPVKLSNKPATTILDEIADFRAHHHV